ncbi:MAG: serine/threonine protein kinase [Chitinivibrionales bacterium]|nr:serine/threonine protein kinase [Chitinivibrionales bacterium]
MPFCDLTPQKIQCAIETATGLTLTGLTIALPSYINRVYELSSTDNTRLIVKFYRPDRWSRPMIEEEHRFVLDCQAEEVPVVAPLPLTDGSTIGQLDDTLFAIFPKKAGRHLEINDLVGYRRVGSLIARLHSVGQQTTAPHRVIIDPSQSAHNDIDHLCATVIPQKFANRYRDIAMQILECSKPLFDASSYIRIHGDCHCGNILNRFEEGLIMIDFDDMAMGPPIQDLWMILPGRLSDSTEEIEAVVQGYEQFRHFNRRSLACIEPLRAMRMIYFLSWCSRQINDFQFRKNFPTWGNDAFWQREIDDLYEQMDHIDRESRVD